MPLSKLRRAMVEGKEKYKNNPVRWIFEMLGVTLWSKQQEIVNSTFFNPKTAVRSCHSAGKTFVAACIVLAFMFLRGPCKVITTAPTYYQVVDLLWSEIRQLYQSKLQERWGFPWEVMVSKLELRPDWYAKGVSPKDTVNFQGYHQKHVLIIGDEAPGIRKEIIEGAETLESSGDVHVLYIGNPITAAGHFYNMFRDPTYKNIAIPADSTPNFTGESVPQEVAAQLVSKHWVAAWIHKYGLEHPYTISKVFAKFPPQSEYQLISMQLCEEAKNRWYDMQEGPEGEDVVGIDVAWYGEDFSVLTRRSGLKIIDIRTCTQQDPVEVAAVAARMYEEKKFRIANVDMIGIGAGTLAELKQLSIPCAGINSAETAFNIDDYCNRRTELWFDGRDFLVDGGGIPDNMDLLADLTTPEYSYKIHKGKSKYWVDSKDVIKKKLKRSTDYGDSYNLSVTDDRRHEYTVDSSSVSVETLLAQAGLTPSGLGTSVRPVRVSDYDILTGRVSNARNS